MPKAPLLSEEQALIIRLFDAIQSGRPAFTLSPQSDAQHSSELNDHEFQVFLNQRIAKRGLHYFLTHGAHQRRTFFRDGKQLQSRFTDDASRDVFIFSPAAATLIENLTQHHRTLITATSGESTRPKKDAKWAKKVVTLPALTPADHLLFAQVALYFQKSSPRLQALSKACGAASALAYLALSPRLNLGKTLPPLSSSLFTILEAIPQTFHEMLDLFAHLQKAPDVSSFVARATQSARIQHHILRTLVEKNRLDLLGPFFAAHARLVMALQSQENIRHALAKATAASTISQSESLLAALRELLEVTDALMSLKTKAQQLRFGDADYDALQYLRSVVEEGFPIQRQDVAALVQRLSATLS